MNYVMFVRKVQDAIETRMHVDRPRTEDLIGTVFSALSARLTRGEGENLISQLSIPLKELWHREAAPKPILGGTDVEKLSKDQFLAKIANEGRLTSKEEAEFVSQCVFHVLKEAVSTGEIRDVADQLPLDLRELMLAA